VVKADIITFLCVEHYDSVYQKAEEIMKMGERALDSRLPPLLHLVALAVGSQSDPLES